MVLSKHIIGIFSILFLLCAAAGAVCAAETDNTVSYTWVNATNGAVYAGYNTSAYMPANVGNIIASDHVYTDTESPVYFAVDNISSTCDPVVSLDVTFTLPTEPLAGSNVSLAASPLKGAVVSTPIYTIDYGDGSAAVPVVFGTVQTVHTYPAKDVYSPSAVLNGYGYFGTNDAAVTFSPAQIDLTKTPLQFNLTAGEGFVLADDKYYIGLGSSVNITVSVKYNYASIGWDPAKENPAVNMFNITASAVNFTVPENLTSVVYTPNDLAGNYTPLSMSGNALNAKYEINTSILLVPGDHEVILGNITITAPDTWDGWNVNDPFNITFDNALMSDEAGALVGQWTGKSIYDEGIWTSIYAPDEAFTLYPLLSTPEIYSVKYSDGRYVYEQELDSSDEGPVFYLYNDIFNGPYSDSSYGNFTLNITHDSPFVKGYFWNTSAFGDAFQFNAAETVVKTNIINRSHFSTSDKKVMDVALNLSGSKVGVKNISVKIENYLQSQESNLLSGWFFDTPYNVTVIVRPGPAAINTTAGTVAWDSAIAYDEFANGYGSSTGYVWSGVTSGNTNVTFADNFVGGQNITVTKSDVNLAGADAVIILTGERLGDVNMNGVVNLNDASTLGFIIEKDGSVGGSGTYQEILDEAAFTEMSVENVMLLDCNEQGGSGDIDIADLREMNKWLSYIYSGTSYGYDDWKSA